VNQKFQSGLSRADLRLQIEAMLLRRDSSVASWNQLGDDARALLADLLDDQAIRSRKAIFHRLIGVNAQLMIRSSVAPLAGILTDESESSLTKAYAANALGRIGEPAALAALAASVNTNDEMVRRQVAIALGRIDREEAIPDLIRLQDDKSPEVAEVASQALAGWEKKLNRKLVKRKPALEK